MKRVLTLLLAASILVLAGCGSGPAAEKTDPLALLRQEIADSGSQCGVAYLGAMPDDGDVTAWLAENGWTQTFPFLKDLKERQVVTQPGNEVYCIVPAAEDARVTVQAFDPLYDVQDGEVLYEAADGAPVCLRGNVSDIMSNLSVTVETADGRVVYQPSLSLMDGTVNIIAAEGSVYDFTPGASHGAPPIRELYSEEFDYTDGVGNSGHYTYHVPQLLADTEGAAAINSDVENKYGAILREVLETKEGGFSLSCLYIAWETYQYGDILSLLVSCGWGYDMDEYSVYLYDTVSGRQLTTADLLAALHVDETAFLDAVRQAAAERFDGQYGAVGGDDAALLAERRDWTLSEENINLDVMAYTDAKGVIRVVLPIGSIAGASAYEQVLTPDLGTR